MLSCMDNVTHCKYFNVPLEVDFERRTSWRNLGENANESLCMFKTSRQEGYAWVLEWPIVTQQRDAEISTVMMHLSPK